MKDRVIHSISLQRPCVGALLFALFCLAYIAGPYWTLPSGLPAQLTLLGLTTLVAVYWSWQASGNVSLRVSCKNIWLHGLLVICLLLLNFNALSVDLPMRGDEDYHITVVQQFSSNILSTSWFHLFFICLIGVTLFLLCKKGKDVSWSRYVILSVATIFAYCILLSISDPISKIYILRYPFVTRIVEAFVPSIVQLSSFYPAEWTYRVVPFLSILFISIFSAITFSSEQIYQKIIWAIAVATMPVLFYYTSILYLEMPAVLLMIVVCYKLEPLLKDPFDELKKQPAWYALIIIGFVKETVLVFLVLVVAFRWGVQCLQYMKKDGDAERHLFSRLQNEITFSCITLIPLVIYLLYRSLYGTTRETTFELAHLLVFKVYPVLLQSFWEQFGFFCVLFIVGSVLLLSKRRVLLPLFSFALVLGYSLFYILDNTIYVGYSRFNLFIVPVFIILGRELFVMWAGKRGFSTIFLVFTIVANIMLCPLNLDGTKKAMWGNYFVDTSEHYYPYRETIMWLQQNHEKGAILFSGMNYPYYFQFYFNKLNWHPRCGMLKFDNSVEEKQALVQALEMASRNGADVVVFQLRGDMLPELPGESSFKLEKIIRNKAHTLAVLVERIGS